ncbi:MAG TPA: asparagine synthase (glutamine-hydrolyzing) [Steroidobacteraceae bacterium]|nr:asparagine synthase (glutamine-hydrolyzing) [Steroidobacteraceae bacterium]
MCGLVAIIDRQGQAVSADLLRRMADRIAHRGPDDEGVYTAAGVGLFHKRLSIIDLSSGHQPMTVEDVTVVFNGEIYNYVELREELKRLGHSFRTTSDTEVLLRCYLQYGDRFVERLNGMFAFVLHDAPRRRVFAARDHFGVKPLYYYVSDRSIVYGSEIKALLAHPEVRASVDPVAMQDYVALQFVLGERTLFKDVRKLPPAWLQTVDLRSNTIHSERYWKPAFPEKRLQDEEECVEQLRTLLKQSVREQLRSDVPVGAYLSGGLDSSTVAVLATGEIEQKPLQTFTGAFREGMEYDETRYSTQVARACGAVERVIFPTAEDFIELLPKLVYQMDEPAAGPGLFPQYMVSRLAQRCVKVCLGGQGGDEIFGGYSRYLVGYLEQALKASVTGVSDEQGLGVELQSMSESLSGLKQYVPMLSRLLKEDLFGPMERRYFRLIDRSEGQLDLYGKDFRAGYDAQGVYGRYARVFNEAGTPSHWEQMTYFDMVTSLPALLQVEDRVSMAVSLESRVPLLDPRIVDFVCQVSPRVKYQGGELKRLFKRAIRPWLPGAVWDRVDKMGFPVPLQQWARGKVGEFLRDILQSRACRERGLFDPAAVARLIETEGVYGRALWGVVQLELWHRQFIDQPAAA